MAMVVRAVYRNGALHPAAPLSLSEGAAVEVTVAPVESLLSENDIVDRIAKSKTIEDWFAATQLLPEGDSGYDIVDSLRENRIWSGEAPLQL